ncbi:methionyl-tRNA synthetase [Coniosporium tulheliwenetii]|uniref:Methionyl-tRNA synthetase n=1 Tax=Coniosporium tulheliwenetii TaxID=3383036 RepID=A0ACC2ZD98_9PEZI|nr:methionyl-tRNA synthetase [Cladosporium sp. JES 115]
MVLTDILKRWQLLQGRTAILCTGTDEHGMKHEGWYSVSDETFYPQSQVHLILDPATGRKIYMSMETGKEVEWTSETNYHFRLSAFRDRLLSFYAENPDWVKPASRMADVVQAVSSGLEDLSISRPVERLSWGIRVPDDESQTIYVWLDALVNYITKAGYPWQPGKEHVHGWPADVQVIGKDIVRFHCIYWPAFLFALDIPPPRNILTHAHWTLGKQKMAKSTGNVVNPFFALDRFGVDTMRYYLAHDGGIAQDADYSNYYIIERYKKGLQGGLGNLASRVMRGKGWSVRRAVQDVRHEIVDASPCDVSAAAQRAMLLELPDAVAKEFGGLNVSNALKAVMDAVYELGSVDEQIFTCSIAVETSPEVRERVVAPRVPEIDRTIFLCAETLRMVGILLQPYVPNKAAQLLDMLGVQEDRRSFEHARLGSDDSYGESSVELGRGPQSTLFPPLASDL